jgi:putative transcriptional regulator
MTFSYNPLWKILIDKGMTKEQLRQALNLSPSTVAKMGRGENISLEVIGRICSYLNCQPGDIMEYIPDNEK